MRRVALIVLDGLGLNPSAHGNAISRQTMPFLHALMDRCGCAALAASGPEVGLDARQVGNSEVGHLTIGAGRVVGTSLHRIRHAFESGAWEANPVWNSLRGSARVHVAGLLSDAAVHAHLTSLVQTAQLARKAGAREVVLHLFLDGVDSPRGSAPRLLADLRTAIRDDAALRIGTISGRRWACDRSGDRALSEQCVNGLLGQTSLHAFSDAQLEHHIAAASESSFPFSAAAADGLLRAGEPIVLTHHRADRIRQLAGALAPVARTYSLVELEGALPAERVFFPTEPVRGGLVDTLLERGIRLARVAETCKFPHVTFFLNGMREIDAKAIEIPSIAEACIARQPEMSLPALTRRVLELMADPAEQAIAVNIANLDQVGHTGDFALAQQAAHHVDDAVAALQAQADAHGWTLLLTADHGNADQMLDDADRPLGSHSPHPVPLVIAAPAHCRVRLDHRRGTLAHVAPTFLAMYGIAPAPSMAPALITLQ